MLGLLHRYLGKYVYGLDAESLRISVWRGDVELSNLRLKPEALDELNLPITVKSGLLGRLTLKVRVLHVPDLSMCVACGHCTSRVEHASSTHVACVWGGGDHTRNPSESVAHATLPASRALQAGAAYAIVLTSVAPSRDRKSVV